MANLEDMFKKATASQQQVEVQKNEEKIKEVESLDAETKAKKDEIERLLVEANATEDERKKAIDLKKQAEELIKDKNEVTEEMKEFLKSADDMARVHSDKIKALTEQMKSLSEDPAVMNMIQTEAEEFNQKRDLNKKFYSTGKEIQGNLCNYNTVNGKKYNELIGGHYGDDDPQALLEMYGSMATGDWNGKASLEDAKDSVDILERINEESKNPNPDMKKIDGEYANFLYKRLQHFMKTFDQRIEKKALNLQEYYKNNPGKNELSKYNELSLEKWKNIITSENQYKTENISQINSSMKRVEEIMKSDGFKAKKLAEIGNEISNNSNMLLNGHYSNPFYVDELKEK